MKHICSLLATILFLTFSFAIKARDAFAIKVQVHGIRDTICLLANHFGDKQYIQDSARCDSQGKCVFKSEKPLREGMYMIVLPNKRFFEIIIDKQKFFSVDADTFAKFQALFDKPLPATHKLRRLLKRKAPWDK